MFIWFSPFQGHKSKVKWFLVTEIKRESPKGGMDIKQRGKKKTDGMK